MSRDFRDLLEARCAIDPTFRERHEARVAEFGREIDEVIAKHIERFNAICREDDQAHKRRKGDR